MNDTVVPHSFSDAAAALAQATASNRPVRIVGGGTKLGWGSIVSFKESNVDYWVYYASP